MSTDEINRAIAEHLGYYCVSDEEGSGLFWLQTPDGNSHGYKQGVSEEHAWKVCCPDYSEDLNAMHEAERAAFGSSTQWVDFAWYLLAILQANDMSVADGMTCVLQATAAQRAEAFLRTIGKWRDE